MREFNAERLKNNEGKDKYEKVRNGMQYYEHTGIENVARGRRRNNKS